MATVEGVVVDSLHGGPLVGAEVMAEGMDRLGITDSTGHFRIDSVAAGRYRLGLFHPLLDSIGVGIVSPPVPVVAGQTLEVALATPSPAATVALACGGAPPPSDTSIGVGPSALLGRVLDAETDEPVAGVRVSLFWNQIKMDRSGLHQRRLVRDTVSGRSGEFRFCALPASLEGIVRIAADTGTRDFIGRAFAMNRRLVGFAVLRVPRVAPTATAAARTPTGAPTDSSGKATPGAVLTGRVTTSEGGPVPGAQIQLVGGSRSTTTGDSGQFTLRGLPTGTRTVSVLAVGWNPVERPVDLALRAPSQIVIPMGVRTAVLDTVVVAARLKAGYDRVGFNQRKARGVGRYLDATEIERRGAGDFFGLMAGMPGVRLALGRGAHPFLAGTRSGNGCIGYFVDGTQYREMTRGDIDNFVRPEEIGGIEVYQPLDGPVHYVGGANAMGCVTIMIWTKSTLGL